VGLGSSYSDLNRSCARGLACQRRLLTTPGHPENQWKCPEKFCSSVVLLEQSDLYMPPACDRVTESRWRDLDRSTECARRVANIAAKHIEFKKGEQNGLSAGNLARRVAGRPQGAARQGKGIHPSARRAERSAPQIAESQDRKRVYLRGPGRKAALVRFV
jgi:hypothetical protein